MSYCPIFNAYPRKVGHDKAKRAIEKYVKGLAKETGISKLEAHAWTLERTIEFAARHARAGTDRKYIPHPATWFNRQGPAEDPLEWGPPDTPKEQETPSRGVQSQIDPIWVEAHWDSIVREYGLPCPNPLIIEKLPTILKDLVEEAWEKHSISG